MTSPQISPASAPPVAEVREGAALRRTGAAGLAIPPVTSPARSTEQTCTRCLRSGAIKVTVNVGDRRWRFCELCLSRGDKTTLLAAVTCKHPFARAHHGGEGGGTTYACIDCFEPVPAPAEVGPCDCGLCAEAGRASLATVLSLGLFGTVLASIAAATGKAGWVIDHLPLTPTPNGFTLLCLLVLAAGCAWRMRRAGNRSRVSLDRIRDLDKPLPFEKWPAHGAPLKDATWPDLDPDEARPTLLPIDERVRS